ACRFLPFLHDHLIILGQHGVIFFELLFLSVVFYMLHIMYLPTLFFNRGLLCTAQCFSHKNRKEVIRRVSVQDAGMKKTLENLESETCLLGLDVVLFLNQIIGNLLTALFHSHIALDIHKCLVGGPESEVLFASLESLTGRYWRPLFWFQEAILIEQLMMLVTCQGFVGHHIGYIIP
ncbi:hypothetical protein ACJX0J_039666, partial [Zea mays]